MLNIIQSPDTYTAMLRIGTPLLLVAIGVAISIKANIFNIAVEGIMLIGAFTAVYFSAIFESIWLGLFFTVLATTIVALIYGFVTITLKADQIISGLGINLIGTGITTWYLQSVLKSPGLYTDPRIPDMPTVNIAFINKIPVIGEIFGNHPLLTPVSWVIALLAFLFLHRSKFGLRLRATGEHPVAATTVGVNIVKWQYIALMICGFLCGLAGAALSLSNLGLFSPDMTAGRGFIAFAAASFASGNIPGTVLVSFVFALFSSISIRLEGLGLPSRILQTIPYLITIIALVFARRNNNN